MVQGTLLVYLLAGAAVALRLAHRLPAPASTSLVRFLVWPLFAPLLAAPAAPADPFEERIRAALASLDAALTSLSGAVGEALRPERRRVEALGHALRSAAARWGELDRTLARPEHDLERLQAEVARAADGSTGAILRERLEHVRRLAALRDRTAQDVEQTLARAQELSARLTLLRFDATPSAAVSAQELTVAIGELCSVWTEARS
jgi:hypothetical protein